jgi:hypothetical protein
LKLGHYDDLEKYVRKNAVVTNSLPTADSGGRSQHSYEPDGIIKAMQVQGWFDKGGIGENWKLAFMPCVNVDTGLTEPQHLRVFKRTASGIPTFTHAYKRIAEFSNEEKCKVCYRSMKRAFELQDMYGYGEDWEAEERKSEERKSSEQMAVQVPLKAAFLGFGYSAENTEDEVFKVPMWVRLLTTKFNSMEELYKKIVKELPRREERVDFFMYLTALIYEFSMEYFGVARPHLIFFVYSLGGFIRAVQNGRFNDLVLLARQSQESNARDYSNELIRTRLMSLLSVGVSNDNFGIPLYYDDFLRRKQEFLDREKYIDPLCEWIFMFQVVEIDVLRVYALIDPLVSTDGVKMQFMGRLHDFLSFAGNREIDGWVRFKTKSPLHRFGKDILPPRDDVLFESKVKTLRDFVSAVLAKNYFEILVTLQSAAVTAVGINGDESFDLGVIYRNMEKVLVHMGSKAAEARRFTRPAWIATFNYRRRLRFVRDENWSFDDAQMQSGLKKLLLKIDSMKSLSESSLPVKIISPMINDNSEFFDAVVRGRIDDLAHQVISTCMYCPDAFFHDIRQNLEAVLEAIDSHFKEINEEEPEETSKSDNIPTWVIKFSRIVNVDVLYTVLYRVHGAENGFFQIFKANLSKLYRQIDEHEASEFEFPNSDLARVKSRSIDTTSQFIQAVKDADIDVLVYQVLSSQRRSDEIDQSAVVMNIVSLIRKIRKMHPSTQTVNDVDELYVNADNDDTSGVQSSIWVLAFNEHLSPPAIDRLYSAYVEGTMTEPQRRLNFVLHLGRFIDVLRRIHCGNTSLIDKYGRMNAPNKGLSFFVASIESGNYDRSVALVMKCIRVYETDRGRRKNRFVRPIHLNEIIENLSSLHIKSLTMNNKVFFLESEFVTPQWVFEFTNETHSDAENVSLVFDMLKGYIGTHPRFSVSDFLSGLDAFSHELSIFNFRGILIKSPILTFEDVFHCIHNGMLAASRELFSIVYYEPDGQSNGRFDRFKARFQMFNTHCQGHLIAEVNKDSHGQQSLNVSSNMPQWIYTILNEPERSLSEIFDVLGKLYNSQEKRFLFWKSFSYLVFALDKSHEKRISSAITGIDVFVQALFDERFDDILACILNHITTADILDKLEGHMKILVEEIKADGQLHYDGIEKNSETGNIGRVLKYGPDFREWKTIRDREEMVRESEYRQEHGEPPDSVSEDKRKEAELKEWLAYTPVDFEDLIPDDKDSIGKFMWVMDLVQRSGEFLATEVWRIKPNVLDLNGKKSVCNRILNLNADVRKKLNPSEAKAVSLRPKKSKEQAEHRPIYSWMEFVLHLKDEHRYVSDLTHILLLCNGKRLGRVRIQVILCLKTLQDMNERLQKFIDGTRITDSVHQLQLQSQRVTGNALITHSNPMTIIAIGASSVATEFMIKKTTGVSSDSLFECIRESIQMLLDSGIPISSFYSKSFSENFHDKETWCNSQRSIIMSDMNDTIIRRNGIDRKKSDLVKEYYFQSKKSSYFDQIKDDFVNPAKRAAQVAPEMMRLISDRYYLTIYVTDTDFLKKIEAKKNWTYNLMDGVADPTDVISMPEGSKSDDVAPGAAKSGQAEPGKSTLKPVKKPEYKVPSVSLPKLERIPAWIMIFNRSVRVFDFGLDMQRILRSKSFQVKLVKLKAAIEAVQVVTPKSFSKNVITDSIQSLDDFVGAVLKLRLFELAFQVLVSVNRDSEFLGIKVHLNKIMRSIDYLLGIEQYLGPTPDDNPSSITPVENKSENPRATTENGVRGVIIWNLPDWLRRFNNRLKIEAFTGMLTEILEIENPSTAGFDQEEKLEIFLVNLQRLRDEILRAEQTSFETYKQHMVYPFVESLTDFVFAVVGSRLFDLVCQVIVNANYRTDKGLKILSMEAVMQNIDLILSRKTKGKKTTKNNEWGQLLQEDMDVKHFFNEVSKYVSYDEMDSFQLLLSDFNDRIEDLYRDRNLPIVTTVVVTIKDFVTLLKLKKATSLVSFIAQKGDTAFGVVKRNIRRLMREIGDLKSGAEELSDCVVFKPSMKRLLWENQSDFARRTLNPPVSIFLKYCKQEESGSDETGDKEVYSGYEILCPAQMTRIFAMEDLANDMQRNVVEMLMKYQKQCKFRNVSYSDYRALAYAIRIKNDMENVPFTPKHNFFLFSIHKDFIGNLGRTVVDGATWRLKPDLQRGWRLFLNGVKEVARKVGSAFLCECEDTQIKHCLSDHSDNESNRMFLMDDEETVPEYNKALLGVDTDQESQIPSWLYRMTVVSSNHERDAYELSTMLTDEGLRTFSGNLSILRRRIDDISSSSIPVWYTFHIFTIENFVDSVVTGLYDDILKHIIHYMAKVEDLTLGSISAYLDGLINQLNERIGNPHDTINKDLATMKNNLSLYEFDTIDGASNYTLQGEYSYVKTEINWRKEIFDWREQTRDTGMIFDSVQLTQSDNRNLPVFARDLVFESVHVQAYPSERDEIRYYLSCIWMSLLSLLFHDKVNKIEKFDISKEQYYFLSAVIGRLSDLKSFYDFVYELCIMKLKEIKEDLAKFEWTDATLRKKKEESGTSCQETIDLLAPLPDAYTLYYKDYRVVFGIKHKQTIATVLNLFIIESELDRNMRLSPDRAHFVVRRTLDIVGSDSFYINFDVFPQPNIMSDPVKFYKRIDFIPHSVLDEDFNLFIQELDFLQDFNWKAGPDSTFFECIVETCYLKQNKDGSAPNEGKSETGANGVSKTEAGPDDNKNEEQRTKLYQDDEQSSGAAKLQVEFISVLNLLYEWYSTGLELEKKYTSMESSGGDSHTDETTKKDLVRVSDFYIKIKIIIQSMVDYRWKHIVDIISKSLRGGDTLPEKGGVVTAVIWEALLQLVNGEDYVPSLFEMQVMADFLGVTICVFKQNGMSTITVNTEVVGKKTVPFVFMPSIETKKVLVLLETVDHMFRIMKPATNDATKDLSFTYPFFMNPYESEEAICQNIASVRPVKEDQENLRLDIVLNTKPLFYEALADLIRCQHMQALNITKTREFIYHSSWVKLVDLYIHCATEIFREFFFKQRSTGDGIGMHEYISDLALKMKQDYSDSGEFTRTNAILQLKKNNDALLALFVTVIPDQQYAMKQRLYDIDKLTVFIGKYHSIMAAENFESNVHADELPGFTNRKNTHDTIEREMRKWLSKIDKSKDPVVKFHILTHHYGKLIDDKRKEIGDAEKSELQNFKNKLWSKYIKSEFTQKLPSEFELEQLAQILKTRIIVYSNAWSISKNRLLKYRGTHQILYDVGFNRANGLIFAIGDNNSFSFMLSRDNVPLRKEKNTDDASSEKFNQILYKNWKTHDKDIKKLAAGEFTDPPVRDFLYKFLGVDPLWSREKIVTHATESGKAYQKPLKLFHPDHFDNFARDGVQFRPVLGPYGPQTFEEAKNVYESFELYCNEDKPSMMLAFAWQVVCDNQWRFAYHTECKFIPKIKRDGEYRPTKEKLEKKVGLGEKFELWSSEHNLILSHDPLGKNSPVYFKNFIARIPVFIQVKGNSLDANQLMMETSNNVQYDITTHVLSNELRDLAIQRFKRRFDVKPTIEVEDGDNASHNIYAVMIPIRRSSSKFKCGMNDFKAYIIPDREKSGELHMNRVGVFGLVMPADIPDMKIQAFTSSRDFEMNAKWGRDWCGLKMCVQTAFYFAKYDARFMRRLKQYIGDTGDWLRFEWLNQFFGNDTKDDFSLYVARKAQASTQAWQSEDKAVNFLGITNPYHVNYATLKEMVGLLRKTAEATNVGESGEVEINRKIYRMLVEAMDSFSGEWGSDEKITNSFIDIDIKMSESNASESERTKAKKDKSMKLMRLLGMAFNVEFVIMECFPDHDLNSLKRAKANFHYYTITESGEEKPVSNLDRTFIKKDGLHWPMYPTSFKNVIGQNLKSLDGIDAMPLKACPLPVYIIWDNDKWNFLQWKELYNTAIAEEKALDNYMKRMKLIDDVKRREEKSYGPDWKGGAPSKIPPANGKSDEGLGHFSAHECGEANQNDEEEGGRGKRNPTYEDRDDRSDPDDNYDGDWMDDDTPDYSKDRVVKPQQRLPVRPMNLPSRRFEREHGVTSLYQAAQSGFSLEAKCSRRKRRVLEITHPCGGKLVKKTHSSFDEDQKEIHFMSQKVPMAVNVLKYLNPYGCCDLKLQMGQMEQTKILAVLFACCFETAAIVPIKGCYTTQMIVACKGLRKDIVQLTGIREMLKGCFDLRESSFHHALSQMYSSGVVSPKKIDSLMQQVQSASDELWADDFRCSLILARSYIQATLEGRVSPAPEYLSPKLAEMMNRRVFSKVTPEQRNTNKEMIRTLMKSNIGDQLLPLFRVVFHPDLHTWRTTLPQNYKKLVHNPESDSGACEGQSGPSPRSHIQYWQWDDALGHTPAPAASRFDRYDAFARHALQ